VLTWLPADALTEFRLAFPGESEMTTLQSVQAILQTQFHLTPEVLQPGTALKDLAIDSLAVIEVLFAIEYEFNITVPLDPAALQTEMETIGDLVARVDKLVAEQHPARVEGA
jgi:acyl carrier protein